MTFIDSLELKLNNFSNNNKSIKTQIITNLNLEKEQARERLRLPQAPQPNQIEENPEVDEEEEEEEEEEHVLASSKLMLKIAQKLDLKKKYRLADKLTYILGKSNV